VKSYGFLAWGNCFTSDSSRCIFYMLFYTISAALYVNNFELDLKSSIAKYAAGYPPVTHWRHGEDFACV